MFPIVLWQWDLETSGDAANHDLKKKEDNFKGDLIRICLFLLNFPKLFIWSLIKNKIFIVISNLYLDVVKKNFGPLHRTLFEYNYFAFVIDAVVVSQPNYSVHK